MDDARLLALLAQDLLEQVGELHLCLLALAVHPRRHLDAERGEVVPQALVARRRRLRQARRERRTDAHRLGARRERVEVPARDVGEAARIEGAEVLGDARRELHLVELAAVGVDGARGARERRGDPRGLERP